MCCTVSKTDTSKGKRLSQKNERERERDVLKNLKHQQRTMHVSFVFATGAFYIDMGGGSLDWMDSEGALINYQI